jgi:hypothetical protein
VFSLQLGVTGSTITEAQTNSMGGCVQLLGDDEISKMDLGASEASITRLSGSAKDLTCWEKMKAYITRYRAV